MVKDMLCTGPVHALPALINQCNFSAEAFLLVEKLPQQVVQDDDERQHLLYFAHLRDIQQKDIVLYTSYTSGRVFDKECELRWEHDTITGKTSTVYLGKPCALDELTQNEVALVGLNPVANKRYYYLFGQLIDEHDLEQMGIAAEAATVYYAEVRIPRLLLYPRLGARSPQRLKLAIYEYIDQETGRVKLFRFQGLQPAE